MEIRLIGAADRADINIPNDPFPLRGRLELSYQQGVWNSRPVYLPEEQVSSMCFPDENYDYDDMAADHYFVGAYEDDRCIGLAILQKRWNRYLYLEDLKVNADSRRSGAGRAMILRSAQLAEELGLRGISCVCQDNNLDACLFYLSMGFEIGGMDMRVYDGTSQEGKYDIFLYRTNA